MVKILCVDDEPSILGFYQRHFRRAIPDLEIVTAGDGQEALEKYDSQISAILTDNNMPRKEGIEFLTGLRARERKLPPTVLLTGLPNAELYQQCREVGVIGVLGKPVDTRHLTEIIKRMLVPVDLSIREYFTRPEDRFFEENFKEI